MKDIFESFIEMGIFEDVMQPVIEENGKKKEKKKKEKSNASDPIYKGPFSIVFDCASMLEFGEEKDYTKKEILELVDKQFQCELFVNHEREFRLNELSKEMYLLRPGYSSRCEKGTAGKKILLQQLTNLEQLIEPSETGEFSVESVKTYIKETYGLDVILHLVEDIYIPEVCLIKEPSIEGIKFPVRVSVLTLFGEILEIAEEDYKAFEMEIKKQETGLLQEGIIEDEVDEEEASISEEKLKKLLATFLPEYAKDMQYTYDLERDLLQVMHKSIGNMVSQKKVSEKKEETYPSDAIVSLVFTRLKLSSDLFGGRKEITKKELLKYIGKQYPEYSAERTDVTYDKKANLILPILKSGKRGIYELNDTDEYRYEDTELMSVCAIKEETDCYSCVHGIVYYHLPKIPFSILLEIMHFFWDVYVCRGTEAIAQIFYKRETKEYEVYYPKQDATVGNVDFIRDPEREVSPLTIPVMEIHSHGAFVANWSMTDNMEELAHRLYAVVGEIPHFHYDNVHIRVRAATGGYYVQLDINEIFELPVKLFGCAKIR